VDHYLSDGYFATVEAELPDGRQVTASVSGRSRADQSEQQGFLSLSVGQPCVLVPYTGPCIPSAYGSVDLTGHQVHFDRGLRTASVEDVTLTLTTPPSYLPGGGLPGGPLPGGGLPPGGDLPPYPPVGGTDTDTPAVPPTYPAYPPSGGPTGSFTPPVLVPGTTEVVTVSLVFTGTGTVIRSAEHTVADCGEDSTGCQSMRLTAERTADVTVTVGWQDGDSVVSESDAGRLTYGKGVDAAAKRQAQVD
jgi:hypothetical protein